MGHEHSLVAQIGSEHPLSVDIGPLLEASDVADFQALRGGSTIRSICLKIVVSPVRVRVSP
jgi:hypothetical protein